MAIVFAAAGCENVDRDMHDQPSYRVQEAPRRTIPEGAVPVSGLPADYSGVDGATLAAPFPLDGKAAAKGEKLYGTYCAVCHGEDGTSRTQVADKMDARPFSLVEESAMALTDGEIFVKILESDTLMPNYRNELSDGEAWEITAFVRKLQQDSIQSGG